VQQRHACRAAYQFDECEANEVEDLNDLVEVARGSHRRRARRHHVHDARDGLHRSEPGRESESRCEVVHLPRRRRAAYEAVADGERTSHMSREGDGAPHT
jgi:hypothetical protein